MYFSIGLHSKESDIIDLKKLKLYVTNKLYTIFRGIHKHLLTESFLI